jgi:hypothetical protein
MLDVMRVQTIMAVVLLGLSAFLIGGNYVGIVRAKLTKVGFSCIPILGGLSGCAGFLLLPGMRLFAFIPLLVDPGGLLMLLPLLLHILKKPPADSR